MKRCPAELVGALCLALAGCAANDAHETATIPPEPADAPEHIAPRKPSQKPSPVPDDAHLVPPGGRPPRNPSHVKSDASLVPPGGGPHK